VEAYPVLLLLLLASFFEAISLGAYQIIQAQEKMWFSFFAIALPRDLMGVILAYFLTAIYGALGLALAYSISWILASIVTGIAVYFIGLDIGQNRLTRSIYEKT
jgi:hypothetical protein